MANLPSAKISDTEYLERIQKGLGCSEEEAKEILAYDRAIDKAKAKDRLEFDLDLQTEKEATKFAHTGTRKTPPSYKFDKRERKKDEIKVDLIEYIHSALANFEGIDANEITNAGQRIDFTIGENSFYIALTKKRNK